MAMFSVESATILYYITYEIILNIIFWNRCILV